MSHALDLKPKFMANLKKCGANMKCTKKILSLMKKAGLEDYMIWKSFTKKQIAITQRKIDEAERRRIAAHKKRLGGLEARYLK